MENWKGFNF